MRWLHKCPYTNTTAFIHTCSHKHTRRIFECTMFIAFSKRYAFRFIASNFLHLVLVGKKGTIPVHVLVQSTCMWFLTTDFVIFTEFYLVVLRFMREKERDGERKWIRKQHTTWNRLHNVNRTAYAQYEIPFPSRLEFTH